jgi:FG-GAP repeat
MKLKFLIAALFFMVSAHAQNIGIGTTTPIARLHVADSNVLFTGPVTISGTTTYYPPVSGAGSRMMWYPQKAAFRVGFIDGTHWDKDSIGVLSFSSGYNTKAIGPVSSSTGGSTIASGSYSTSMGYGTIANGYGSTSMGYGTIANGHFSTSMGTGTNTSGDASTSMGYYTHANGFNSTSMGSVTTAQGNQSTSMGLFTNARSANSLVIGLYNDTSATNRLFEIGNGTDDNLRANAMTVLDNGNTGIGTSTPRFPLSFNTNNGDKISLYDNGNPAQLNFGIGIFSNQLLQIHSATSGDDIAFGTGSSINFIEHMRIKGNGNVGIGTSTPAEKLQVAGNIKADTVKPNAIKFTPNAGTGKILTSDAAGNANWQALSAGGGVGFGSWGDCSTNSISEYNPVADASGAAGDKFGTSSSISGNYAIVGAYADDGAAGGDQGSASIYQWNGSNWVLMQKLTDATGAANDYFGYSVSISGNYAIVGAPLDDGAVGTDQGSASIFQWNGSNWVLMQKITDATGAIGDFFGVRVSISGNYAIVGAHADGGAAGAEQGSASIYQWNGSNWVLMQKLTDATGAAFDYFGVSVSISGNYAIVGAYADDGAAGADQGSASIYQWNGSNWVLMQKLTDATGAAFDYFGVSVSISGNYAIVGAYQDDGAAGADQGSASIYQWNGSNWVLMQKLTDAGGAANDNFGSSVSISGNYAIVGAYADDGAAGLDQGSASIYLRVGLGWQRLQYITDPGGNAGDLFGNATAIDGATQRFLIGAPYYANASGKVVFGKVN